MASETTATQPMLNEAQGQSHQGQRVQRYEAHAREAEYSNMTEEEKEEHDEDLRAHMCKTLLINGYWEEQISRMIKSRPTYLKVHRRHIDPETLKVYDLPWEWDESYPPNYIIIKMWLPEHDTEILFRHTRRLLKQRKLTDDLPGDKRSEAMRQLLFQAIELGNLMIVKTVLREGAINGSMQHENGKTALQLATDAGHEPIVALLKRVESDKLTEAEPDKLVEDEAESSNTEAQLRLGVEEDALPTEATSDIAQIDDLKVSELNI